MTNWLRYSLIGASVFAVIFVLAIGFLAGTSTGLRMINAIGYPHADRILQETTGSTISYSLPRGRLLGPLIIQDITLSDDDGIWAEAEEIAITWRPLALFSRQIHVTDIDIVNVKWHRAPPYQAEKPDTDKAEKDRRPSFTLPSFVLGKARIDGFQIERAVFGQEYRLNGALAASGKGQHFAIDGTIDTQSGSDLLTVRATYNDDSELLLELGLLSGSDGLFTTALNAERAVWLNLNGQGPLSQWKAALETDLGVYGSLGGILEGDLTKLGQADFRVRAVPEGPKAAASASTCSLGKR
ncbi:MAG: hypothetical protein AAF986_01680, partial [Pseudomonadota bacterium]